MPADLGGDTVEELGRGLRAVVPQPLLERLESMALVPEPVHVDPSPLRCGCFHPSYRGRGPFPYSRVKQGAEPSDEELMNQAECADSQAGQGAPMRREPTAGEIFSPVRSADEEARPATPSEGLAS